MTDVPELSAVDVVGLLLLPLDTYAVVTAFVVKDAAVLLANVVRDTLARGEK